MALQVNLCGARSWVLRIMVGDKRRDMGLGGYSDVLLAQAREAARQACPAVAQHPADLRHPLIGDLLIKGIGLSNVLAVLEPIPKSKTETASRLRGRVESILDWASTRGYRSGLNPARWKGHLDTVLPAPRSVANAGHHSALPYPQVGAFMHMLRTQMGLSARALEFAVLTAARSGEVRGARWQEIDRSNGMWTVPAERMKAGREHRVPLSEDVLGVLAALPPGQADGLVFASPQGGMLSDMSLTAVLRRMKVDAVPHGFRSSFRDWCAERT